MPATRMPAAGRHGRRWLNKRVAAMLVGGVAAVGSGGAIVASAAVPAFPDNLVVFPDRDFVTVEGYQNRIGQTALITVTRGGTVIGSAEGVISEGDVAFEINHPGGYCWGAGTSLQVTPDIKAGDKVSISFAGEPAGDTTVQDTAVDSDSVLDGGTLTVKGHIAAGVNPAQLEQRIVNPDLVGTEVAKRDVRAVPGPLTPAPKGGYSSSLDVDEAAHTFTATYQFDNPATATIAATGGGERMMAWQVEDADANRQGLTIAEYGELGGPGMGGCPLGPRDQAAPAPGKASVTRSEDKTEMQVNWTPATAQPGAAAVSGYDVEAIAQADAAGVRHTIGRRVSADATRVTIPNLNAGDTYTVEVRSLAGPRMSDAFEVQVPAAPSGDLTPPEVTATPAPLADGAVTETKLVTLKTNEAGADIYYTTDGSAVLDNGGLPSDAAKLYATPIEITTQTHVKFVAIDAAGNFTEGEGTFAPPATLAPTVAPTLGASTAGQESVTLKWSSTDPSITGYGVQLYNNTTGETVGGLRETADQSLTITGLTAGTPYSFTVQANNAGGPGPMSQRSEPLTPSALTDRVTIATARWKAGDFRVTGSGTFDGVTVTIREGSATGPILGSGPMTPAVAPATGGVYDLRFRNGAAPPTKPATIYVVSSRGGVAGPFTVANG